MSCTDAIAKSIEMYDRERDTPDLFSGHAVNAANDTEQVGRENTTVSVDKKNYVGACPECPDCGGMLEFSEGCAVCKSCGFSRCF